MRLLFQMNTTMRIPLAIVLIFSPFFLFGQMAGSAEAKKVDSLLNAAYAVLKKMQR
jgi:hypothetical protein